MRPIDEASVVSIALPLAVLFFASGIDKWRSVATRATDLHPVLAPYRLSPPLPPALLAAAAIADWLAAAALVLRAGAGFVLAVLFAYSAIGVSSLSRQRERRRTASCRCFPFGLDA